MLLENGADVTLQDSDSNTVFHIVIKQSRSEEDALTFLNLFFPIRSNSSDAQYKEALGKRNNDGKAPIHLAYGAGYKDVIKFLVDHGAFINRRVIVILHSFFYKNNFIRTMRLKMFKK